MMSFVSNKVILVTGAGRGIGKVIAEQLARDGAIVYINDLEMGEMDGWSKNVSIKYSTKVQPCPFDVTDSSALKKGLMSIFKIEGRIDGVVNNAAIIAKISFGENVQC